MKNKKGISLIVLVVTIIVIIILAGAVILSLTQNNPIEEANKAKYYQDKEAVQSSLNMFLTKQAVAGLNVTTITGTVLATVTSNGTVTAGDAKYSIGGGTPIAFNFTNSADPTTYIIKLPSYAATWEISPLGAVELTVNGTKY